MYILYCDGKVLYYPKLAEEGYTVLNPKLTVELNKPGKLEYLLPASNPRYDSIKKMKSVITVYQEDAEIFRGRCLNDKKDFYKRKKVICEGDMAFLLDSVQRPYSFQGTVSDMFTQYVAIHNSQVDEEKQFVVGVITAVDPNQSVSVGNNRCSDTLTEIKSSLLKGYGGYLRTRSSDGNHYLDWVEDYDYVNTQTIEFGKNLLNLTEYINAQDVFTVLIPLGAQQQDAAGNDAGRLTIESVNGGRDYIEDSAAVAIFGKIWKFQEWDDITDPQELLGNGEAALQAGIEMAVSLEVQAVDLHHAGVDTERLKLGDYVRVVSIPHGLDKYFLCSKIIYDLADPSKNKYTFGITFQALTEQQSSEVKSLQSSLVVVQATANSAQEGAKQASTTVEEMKSVIAEIPTDYVKTEAFETYKEEVEGKISAVYRFKGSVSNYDALPSSNRKIGDVYNMLDTGENYAWTDSGWDSLAGTVNLSGYVTREMYESLEERVKTLEGGNA